MLRIAGRREFSHHLVGTRVRPAVCLSCALAFRPIRAAVARLGVRIRIFRVLALRRGRGAKSRHLNDLAAEKHMRQAKPPADQPAVAKQTPYLIR